MDLVEELYERLRAAEMKWSLRRDARAPGAWRRAYPGSTSRS